jgi:hypothetical protein
VKAVSVNGGWRAKAYQRNTISAWKAYHRKWRWRNGNGSWRIAGAQWQRPAGSASVMYVAGGRNGESLSCQLANGESLQQSAQKASKWR